MLHFLSFFTPSVAPPQPSLHWLLHYTTLLEFRLSHLCFSALEYFLIKSHSVAYVQYLILLWILPRFYESLIFLSSFLVQFDSQCLFPNFSYNRFKNNCNYEQDISSVTRYCTNSYKGFVSTQQNRWRLTPRSALYSDATWFHWVKKVGHRFVGVWWRWRRKMALCGCVGENLVTAMSPQIKKGLLRLLLPRPTIGNGGQLNVLLLLLFFIATSLY